MKRLAYLLLLSASALSAQTAVWPNSVVTDSQLLVASNNCTTRLSAAITDTVTTTLFVVNASPFSTCFLVNNEVQVDSEFMQVKAVGFGQLTVTRGFDNSTASTHQVNTPVNVGPAAWYHNALKAEVESIETWLAAGGGGGGGGNAPGGLNGSVQYNNNGSFGGLTIGSGLTNSVVSTLQTLFYNGATAVYNEGSSNSSAQTVNSKFGQYLSFDDFADNSGNPVSPSASATTNYQGIQNAINFTSPLGIILTCQGTYNYNNTLTLASGTKIHGHGATQSGGGCNLNQTNAAVAALNNTSTIGDIDLEDVTITGGTNGYDVNAGCLTDATFDRVAWNSASNAAIHVGSSSCIQRLTTYNNRYTGGLYGVRLDNASVGTSYISQWHDISGKYAGQSFNCINIDSGGASNDNHTEDFHCQVSGRGPVVLSGFVTDWEWEGYSFENNGYPDVNAGGQVISTCSTSGTSSTTLTCASSSFQNGQVLTVAYGSTFYQDVQETVVSGGGTTTLTVTPAIPQQVTSVDTTNASYDGFALLRSAVNNVSPTRTSFYGGVVPAYASAGVDSTYVRYGINNSSGGTVFLHGVYNGNRPIYDPSVGVISHDYLPGSTNAVIRTPAFPQFNNNSQYPAFGYSYDGSTTMPSVLSGNLGLGFIFQGCGTATGGFGDCGSTGTYGNAWFLPRHANSNRPTFGINYDTGSVSLGLNGEVNSAVPNLLIGNLGLTPNLQGLSNGILIHNGVAPSSTINIASGELYALAGNLYWNDQSNTAWQLTPTYSAPTVFKKDLVNQSAIVTSTNLGTTPNTVSQTWRISWYAKVTTAATSTSNLGTGGGLSGLTIIFTDGTDSTTQTFFGTSAATASGIIVNATGLTTNTTATGLSGSATIFVAAASMLNIQFGYASTGGTAMVYELHVRAEPVDQL